MPELKHLAEWLGIEVIDVEGEFVVRRQLNAHGAWIEREERATREEIKLYDTVRGLVATVTEEGALAPLARVAVVLGLPPTGYTVLNVLEKLAGLLADNRHWREKAVGADAELVSCRREIQELRAGVRLTPKGGDRNELVRQIRRTAHRIVVDHEKLADGAVAMANAVLALLGEEVFNPAQRVELPSEQWEWRQQMAERVRQLRADRWKSHELGNSAYYRNQGEANAFEAVVAFLVGEEEL